MSELVVIPAVHLQIEHVKRRQRSCCHNNRLTHHRFQMVTRGMTAPIMDIITSHVTLVTYHVIL